MSNKVTRWIRAGMELCAACLLPACAGHLPPRVSRRKKRRYWMLGRVLKIGPNTCGHGCSLRADGDQGTIDVTGEEGEQNKKLCTSEPDANIQTKTCCNGRPRREEKAQTRRRRHFPRRRSKKTRSRRKMRDRLLCKLQARKNAIDLKSRYLDLQTFRNSDDNIGISELKKCLFCEEANSDKKPSISLAMTQIDKVVYENVQKRFGHCKSAWLEHEDPKYDVSSVNAVYDAVHTREHPPTSRRENHCRANDSTENGRYGPKYNYLEVYDMNQDGKEDADLNMCGDVSGQNERNGVKVTACGHYLEMRGTKYVSEEHKESTIDLDDAGAVYESSSEESLSSKHAVEGDSQGVFNEPTYALIVNRLTAHCVGLDIDEEEEENRMIQVKLYSANSIRLGLSDRKEVENVQCPHRSQDNTQGTEMLTRAPPLRGDTVNTWPGEEEQEIRIGSFEVSSKLTAHVPANKTPTEFPHDDGQRGISPIQGPERAEEDDITNGSFRISVTIRVGGHRSTDSNESNGIILDINEETPNGNTPSTSKQEAEDGQDLPGCPPWHPQRPASPTAVPGVVEPSALPKSVVGEQSVTKLPKSAVGEQSVTKLPKSPLVGERPEHPQGPRNKPPLHRKRLKNKKISDEIQGPENTVEDHLKL
ncbi:uncharacterized protein [Haliotis cracherodii]|uniref:uncharacterized protein n=1 Tax=Haliotis cracherodii TaxID=6455 RepID=UPI0039E7A0A4